MALQRLREAAEKAKHELSTSLETEVNLPFIAAAPDGPKHLVGRRSTRGKLETLTEDLVDRTFEPCEQALKDAGWTHRTTSTTSSWSAGRPACRACRSRWPRSSARSPRAR